MMRLGLTGGIGMGKSTVAGMFAARGVPGFNADEEVRRLQAPGGAAIPAIAASFPSTVQDGVLSRDLLRALVLSDAAAMKRLEGIMHPMVRAAEARFLDKSDREGCEAVLLDIPLLFESKDRTSFDKVIVVSCPKALQLERVMKRGLPLPDIEAIIARQLPDAQKRALADFVIDTSGSIIETAAKVDKIMQKLGLKVPPS